MKNGITVLICTYNGSLRLPQTLSYLACQLTQPNLSWEIIIVDNASTDKTADTARKEWEKYNLSDPGFSILEETRPGKINALETGTRHSKYEYFIICDDDNWLSPEYVQQAYNTLESDPCIGAVGGRAIPVNDSGVYPDWFSTYKNGYAIGEQGSKKGDVTHRGYLFGAGLATRTALYIALYKNYPSLLIGRQGEKLYAGEDGEYCQRLILKGYTLYYHPGLAFNHYLPPYRLEIPYRDALFSGLAESEEILSKYYLITRLKEKLSRSFSNRLRLLVISPFRALFTSDRKKYHHEMNIIRYLLGIRSDKDPIFNAIRKFEKEKLN